MSRPEHVRQAPDHVPGARMLGLAGAALVVSALGVLVSWLMLRNALPDHVSSRAAPSAAFGPGTPERTPIETSERGLALRQAQQRQLTQYGWANRAAGLARIPIERAIDLRAESAR